MSRIGLVKKVVLITVFTFTGIFGQEVINFDCKSVLNARPVITINSSGKIIPSTEGVDDYNYSRLATQAIVVKQSLNVIGMPNDGIVKATNRHPDIKLNFTNVDDLNKQATRFTKSTDTFSFSVPEKKYSKLMIFVMSSKRATIAARVYYTDNTNRLSMTQIMDWAEPLTGSESKIFTLISNFAKWDANNVIKEDNNHYLTGMLLDVDSTKTVKRILFSQTTNLVVTFWGATGIVAKPTSIIPWQNKNYANSIFTFKNNKFVFNSVPDGKITFQVIDLQGGIINTISMPVNEILLTWNGLNKRGQKVNSGKYIVNCLVSGKITSSKICSIQY
jgi:hypothetical protein